MKGQQAFHPIPGGNAARRPRRASGEQMKARGVAWPLDDLEPQPLLCGGSGGLVALIAAIGEDQLQPRKAAADAAADPGQAVPVLDVGGMNHHDERQAERIGEQVPLAAIDRQQAIDPIAEGDGARRPRRALSCRHRTPGRRRIRWSSRSGCR